MSYGWITNRQPAESICLHSDMVLHVLSQALALNYRLVATCPESGRGVIAFCGRLRGDCDEHYLQPVSAAILHIARDHDEYAIECHRELSAAPPAPCGRRRVPSDRRPAARCRPTAKESWARGCSEFCHNTGSGHSCRKIFLRSIWL